MTNNGETQQAQLKNIVQKLTALATVTIEGMPAHEHPVCKELLANAEVIIAAVNTCKGKLANELNKAKESELKLIETRADLYMETELLIGNQKQLDEEKAEIEEQLKSAKEALDKAENEYVNSEKEHAISDAVINTASVLMNTLTFGFGNGTIQSLKNDERRKELTDKVKQRANAVATYKEEEKLLDTRYYELKREIKAHDQRINSIGIEIRKYAKQIGALLPVTPLFRRMLNTLQSTSAGQMERDVNELVTKGKNLILPNKYRSAVSMNMYNKLLFFVIELIGYMTTQLYGDESTIK